MATGREYTNDHERKPMCTAADVFHPQLGLRATSPVSGWKRIKRLPLHQPGILYGWVATGRDGIDLVVDNDFDLDAIDFDQAMGGHLYFARV